MRGRIPYVIVGYISPTFIKILVDHAISQLGLPFLTVISLLPHFVLSCFFSAFYFRLARTQQEKGRPGNETSRDHCGQIPGCIHLSLPLPGRWLRWWQEVCFPSVCLLL